MYRENVLRTFYRCLRFRFKEEVSSIDLVRHLDLHGSTMLDIGANRGVYSVYMSRAAGPDGRLIAFEPQPELGPHLARVRRQFGLGNMEIVSMGLSSEPGSLELRRMKVGAGGATFEDLGTGLTSPDRFQVPVTTVDAYLAQNPGPPVSFIKCDVEGHELKVFAGARETLTRDAPLLLFEAHDEQLVDGELEALLDELGYEGFFYFVDPKDHASLWHKGRGEYVPFDQRSDYPHCRTTVSHRNYVFVRKGRSIRDYVGE